MFIVYILLFFTILVCCVCALKEYELFTIASSVPISDPMCSLYPPNTETSCLQYIKTCHPDYFKAYVLRDVKDENALLTYSDTGPSVTTSDPVGFKRLSVLYFTKIGTDESGRSYNACRIPPKEFQRYEIGETCPGGTSFYTKETGCVIKLPKPTTEKNRDGSVRFDSNDTLMDMVNSLYDRDASGFKGHDSNTKYEYTPLLPSIDQFPELEVPIRTYYEYYQREKENFANAPYRCGYIRGKIYNVTYKQGKESIKPIVQKRFGNRYFTLIYRYTTASFRQNEVDNLATWFKDDIDWSNPRPSNDIMTDPSLMYKDMNEFLTHKNDTYRDKFLFDYIKNSRSRYSILVEVGNSYSKDPICTIELVRYGSDGGDLLRFFSRIRVRDVGLTSNKKLFENQFDIPKFSIDCGKDISWTIGNLRDNQPCDDFYVYFCIPTGKSCNWQKWFRGNIIVSNGDPINIGGNIPDIEEFRKAHVGEWMNVYACADYHDPFQTIEMNKGEITLNPFAFRSIFNRPANMTDEDWGLYIWKTISGDEATAQYSETYKTITQKLKGKNQLDFKDYIFACKNALASTQQMKFARDMACF